MKILFNYQLPFMLAHGGLQIQIDQTMAGVERAGASVEPLRWWDVAQQADILHVFGRAPAAFLTAAHSKGLPVVQEELLTEQGARPLWRLRAEAMLKRVTGCFDSFAATGNWNSYRLADASIANTEWEARLMRDFYQAPAARVHVVPNGVEDVFLRSEPAQRGRWLVCVATIAERKRVLELAEAAVQARTPLWIVGKPYSDSEPYASRFRAFAASHSDLLRYEGDIADRVRLARVYREARGFVLLSAMETRSLAAEEAAACECPLLLSDLPWARSVFGQHSQYAPVACSPVRTAYALSVFYNAAPGMKPPPKPVSWTEVGRRLIRIYEVLLRTSR